MKKTAGFSSPSFGAVYDRYEFSGAAGEAVIVNTGTPWPFVFWERACYIPWWHIDDQTAFTYEFFETWGKGTVGCCEPMSDKENRYSRVRILQTHEARCVVHWRYALCDQNYKIYDDSTWADEVFYFYPDGYAVRVGTIQPRSPIATHEMMEFIMVNAAGARPADRLWPAALTILGGGERRWEITWPDGTFPREVDQEEDLLYWINLKNRPRPFVALTQRQGNGFTGNGIRHIPWTLGPKDSHPDGLFFTGDNWPIFTVPLEGAGCRIAANFDRPSATCLISFHNRDVTAGPRTWLFLIGMTAEGEEGKAREAARSWMEGAEVQAEAGMGFQGYRPAERAFMFQAPRKGSYIFSLTPRGGALLNPVFVFKGRSAAEPFAGIALSMGGKALRPEQYRAGVERRQRDYDVVVWTDLRLTAPCALAAELF